MLTTLALAGPGCGGDDGDQTTSLQEIASRYYLVGNTMRTLQGVGWLPITPIDIELPLWAGTWFGLFPTVETLGAQAAAFGFVIGSYFLAEWARKRNVRRAVLRTTSVPDVATQTNGSRSDPRLPPCAEPAASREQTDAATLSSHR